MKAPKEIFIPGYRDSIRIYSGILTLAMRDEIMGFVNSLDKPAEEELLQRRFHASKIVSGVQFDFLPQFSRVIGQAGPFTARVNTQMPLKAQGWHQDFVPEAMTLYPEGHGWIDFVPNARSIEEARSTVREVDGIPLSIEVEEGDVAVIGCGAEAYHRGRNGTDEIRRVVVLHQMTGQ